jgi:hypothetical protein
MKRYIASAAALAAAALGTAVLAAAVTSGPQGREPSLGEVRKATERYRDIKVALAEGYIRDPFDLCDTADMMGKPASLGAMGVHYLRPDLLKVAPPGDPSARVNGESTHTDFRKPAILIYEPQKDGSLQLVADENLVFQKAWKAAGHDRPPSFRGVTYDTMQDDPATPVDEAHMFEPHYDRHVWLYRKNPNGMFAPFNPAVSCAHHTGAKGHPGHDHH